MKYAIEILKGHDDVQRILGIEIRLNGYYPYSEIDGDHKIHVPVETLSEALKSVRETKTKLLSTGLFLRTYSLRLVVVHSGDVNDYTIVYKDRFTGDDVLYNPYGIEAIEILRPPRQELIKELCTGASGYWVAYDWNEAYI